ncbi:hypothetical protein [Streptomyces sp. Tue 6075]|uniref:hypothetical protein n=1 Tax=Streptomyces sp. Tue 6075 TaxID=1661694 RepID=UPI000AB4921A|nr:hypothetical protein [Streptomyces sp. Tue 6075]
MMILSFGKAFCLVSGIRLLLDMRRDTLVSWHTVLALTCIATAVVVHVQINSLERDFVRHRYARIYSGKDLYKQLEEHSYVLYLRSFGRDQELSRPEPVPSIGMWLLELVGLSPMDTNRTWEHRIVSPFRTVGKLVAVGQPGEDLPPTGASRFYLPRDNWQSQVSMAIRHCRMVVMAAALGPQEKAAGTLWEYAEVRRLLQPNQFALLIMSDEKGYERFVSQTSTYSIRHPSHVSAKHPSLPSHETMRIAALRRPARSRGKARALGILTFDPDWEPRFTPLTGTSKLPGGLVTTQWSFSAALRNFLIELETRLPGTARWNNAENLASPEIRLLFWGVSVLIMLGYQYSWFSDYGWKDWIIFAMAFLPFTGMALKRRELRNLDRAENITVTPS